MPTYEKITFEIYNNSIKLLRYFLSNNCKSINGYLLCKLIKGGNQYEYCIF